MEIERLALPGLVRIVPKQFADARGAFAEVYSARGFRDAIGDVVFVQDNQSVSHRRGTVRGLHFQTPPRAQAKLVRVLRGAILDVAVDLRPRSPTYLQHVTLELSAANRAQLYVPQGFAHGFCTLEDDTEVFYKCDAFFSAEHDRSVAWNDPDLGVAWPVGADEAILSDKDARAPRLKDMPAPFPDWGI